METVFWHERWATGQIGFHQSEINPHLRRFWPALELPKGSRVFVPLCGKSRDMLWLCDQGYEVIGVELSPVAVEAFFAENDLQPTVDHLDSFSVYRTAGLSLYCGDFFALMQNDLAGVTAVFDRASLVALPPDMRADYAHHMLQLLAPGIPILLIAFAYPQHEMEGPPFSVQEPEICALYGTHRKVQRLHSVDLLEREPRFREKGLSRLEEIVYMLV
ncbi:thiopurine S-methyltransferase [Methylococcus sp. EFPC2]|uniref:thiopurine S-methyltransferase n=1 Tax=Methylococcus sp. EFPC2 TaxID=2812648 RepID=UPI0019671BA6|nr:thiopurine S-methyltransferase [Methylococcus sp. EFPC2]QSA98940.1 thiopurine S-methyltransferase [Methylococcus sp. EFPC2]